MQPWRFIRITDQTLRWRIHALVDDERLRTADALEERAREFLALKVEGILDCAELIVVALSNGRDRHVFGRRTMPYMDLASVSCAIQNVWLAARAEGLGMGWVSLFDPARLARLLTIPADAEPVAILCLGPVPDFPDRHRRELDRSDHQEGQARGVRLQKTSGSFPSQTRNGVSAGVRPRVPRRVKFRLGRSRSDGWSSVRPTTNVGRRGGVEVTTSTPANASPVPESIGYTLKRLFLGEPMITEQLKTERLSNPVAFGVLSPDAISSSAYGTEEILIELLPFAGLAAFTLLLPITGVILFILILVAASYREVVMAYTRAGGSYIVARENFGPRVAQVAAAALLIDYVVTVAVQAAAGTVAVASAVPCSAPTAWRSRSASSCHVFREPARLARGRALVCGTDVFLHHHDGADDSHWCSARNLWGLPDYDPLHMAGAVEIHQGGGLVMGASILVLLRAFANGGSSLTGVEAISNTVGFFRKPGPQCHKVLTAMACILGFLVAGCRYLAYATHSTPFAAGYPSVLSEVGRAVFGGGLIGHVLYVLLQIATAAILFTGANTSFNGFPALASFVAEDRFLPRQLMKRGQRLVFSNGILVLTVLSVVLLIATGGTVERVGPVLCDRGVHRLRDGRLRHDQAPLGAKGAGVALQAGDQLVGGGDFDGGGGQSSLSPSSPRARGWW